MIEPNNPEGLKLSRREEQKTGNHYYQLEQEDGGRITCPIPQRGGREVYTCDSRCAWFYTHCNIPQSLGLKVE
jgi:hypothetical protein